LPSSTPDRRLPNLCWGTVWSGKDVSQMHSSILARLKAQMQHRMRELEPAE
jgi:hypothetical protein